jgi:hypothetical protein
VLNLKRMSLCVSECQIVDFDPKSARARVQKCPADNTSILLQYRFDHHKCARPRAFIGCKSNLL